jgi:hypothetical protein
MSEAKKDAQEQAPETPKDGNGEGTTNPIDEVVRLTETELLKFNHMQLRLEHLQQSVRVLQLEHEQANREFISATHDRNLKIEQHQNAFGRVEQEYQNYVRSLADKYKVPAQYMGIDDETGAVREMPHPTTEEPAEEPVN